MRYGHVGGVALVRPAIVIAVGTVAQLTVAFTAVPMGESSVHNPFTKLAKPVAQDMGPEGVNTS